MRRRGKRLATINNPPSRVSCFQNSDRLLPESKNNDFNLETQSVKHFYLRPCHAVQFFLQSSSTLSACKIGKYMFPIHG